MEDLFKWCWKSDSANPNFFWFERTASGAFGYYVSNEPEVFHSWAEEMAQNEMRGWYRFTPRDTFDIHPSREDIPPVIRKIRLMELRHKAFLGRKSDEMARRFW